jgi:hypothetical protein
VDEKGQATVKQFRQLMFVMALALALFVVMGASTPAAAQPASQQRAIEKVSFGWKLLRVSASEADAVNYPLGFYVDANGDLNALSGWDWIVEAIYARKSESDEDIFGEFDTTSNILMVLGGLKKEFANNPAYTPHCQVLAGFGRFGFSESGDFLGETFSDDFSESAFALKGSCGVDYSLNEKWDVRGGAGYIRAFTESSGTNMIRLFVGVVRRLG